MIWRHVKFSVFRTSIVVNVHARKIHLTPKTLIRGDLRKHHLRSQEKNLENVNDTLISEQSMANFWGIESEEGVITVTDRKLEALPKDLCKKKSREKFYRKSFGIVRYDSDNHPKFHGQYGKNGDFTFPHTSNEYSVVAEEFSGTTSTIVKKIRNESSVHYLNRNEQFSETSLDISSGKSTVINNNSHLSDLKESKSQDNYIEEYYFGNFLEEKGDSQKQSYDNLPSTDQLNFLDKNFFANISDSKNQTQCHKQDFSRHDLLNEGGIEKVCSTVDSKAYAEVIESDPFEVKYLSSSNNIAVPEQNDRVKDTSYNQMNADNIREIDKSILNSAMIEQFENNVDESNSKFDADSYPSKVPLKRNHSQIKDNKELYAETHDKLHNDTYRNNNLPKTVKSVTIKKLSDKTDSQKVVSEESSEVQSVTTAYDFVKNLQKQKENPKKIDETGNKALDLRDSKGFRILKNQVPDLSFYTKEEIISLLKENILYKDDDLVILNKPYSLVIHDSQTTKVPCLDTFLDELAQEINLEIDSPKLYTVHRLDKGTTGCLLLAKNESMAQFLKSLFAQRKIIKKYWILTTKVPDPLQGIIDIPISEGSVNKKKRMVLHPELPKDMGYCNHSKAGKQAVTSYKVLQQSGNSALVEATPMTGIKHQIRVHFGLGLSCPILGDHKYSYLDKLAPQKLQSDLLQRLHVRQSKVRYIPLNIHAKSVMIPQYFEDRDLYVQAPLPKHMRENLKNLKFKKK